MPMCLDEAAQWWLDECGRQNRISVEEHTNMGGLPKVDIGSHRHEVRCSLH